jgi:VWFA-related protein
MSLSSPQVNRSRTSHRPTHCVYLLALMQLSVGLRAQSTTITSTTSLVLVPALVQSPSGETLPIFKASDFLLTDNGVSQHVTLEDTEHQPLSIVVLLQTGANPQRNFPSYTKLGTMLDYLTAHAPHQVAMIEFDSQPEYQWDFSPDTSDIEDGFTKPDPGDHGAAILDAVDTAIDLLRTQPPSYRRIIVLISQTHDDGSRAQSADIVRRLGENNITIECLTFSPEKAWLKDEFTQPRHENPLYQISPDQPPLLHTFNLDRPLREAIGAMRTNTSAEVAALSGGEAFPFSGKSDLEEQLSILANHFAATYTLSFRPSSKQPGFHALHLQIAGQPNLQVSARSSY